MQSLFIIYIFSAMTLKRVNGLDTLPFYNLYPKKGQDGLPHATACPNWENAVYCLVSPVHTPKQSVLPDCDGVSFSTDCAGLSVLPDCDGV
jgi:hypothetical protein